MTNRKRLQLQFPTIAGAVLATSGVLALTTTQPASAQTGTQTHQFDIASGSLDQSLRQYIALTGRQLLYPSTLVASRRAPALRGWMDADEALRILLSGQRIAIRKRGRNVIVLVAQADPKKSMPQERVRRRPISPTVPNTPAARLEDRAPLDEAPIIVTGSNIRSSGVAVSPLIELTAEDIERTGTGTVAEVLALLPQNFGGTANEDTSLTGSDRTINNLGLGSSVNLRGLGSDATLTLVNGRRVAGSGGRGDFTDLSTIPLAAIERIEVMPDGASALYGSDAVARRYFFELADLDTQLKKRRKKAPVISPIAVEAVRRIDTIFDIERAINGRSADERLAARQEHSAKPVADLEAWLRDNRSKLSKSSPVAEPIDYMLKAWPAFTAFLDDGRICLSNIAAERALRGIAPGRKSWLFAGSDRGGQRTAFMLSLIATAKLNDIDPQAWLADVLGRIADIPQSQLADLLPWNWRPAQVQRQAA